MSSPAMAWIEKPRGRRGTAPREWRAEERGVADLRERLRGSCGHMTQDEKSRLSECNRYAARRFGVEPDAVALAMAAPGEYAASVGERFRRLADEWSRRTGHISSASDLINEQGYQEIISLGWGVVPHLLRDLQEKRRFWFPALAAITGVRPFDTKDASSPRRMAEAWLRWGKRKGLI
jgi:hypothetical protein